MKKTIVWLDVDDVLLDFKNRHNKFLRKKYKVNIPDDYVPQTWDYLEVLKHPLTFIETLRALGTNWSRNQKALPQAKEFTQKLKKAGVRVILITHIEGEQGPDRIANLVKNGITFDEIYFTMGRKKSDFMKALILKYPGCRHVFVDDKASNVIDFLKTIKESTLGVSLDLPFNQEWLKEYRGKKLVLTKNYLDMYDVVLKFLKIKK